MKTTGIIAAFIAAAAAAPAHKRDVVWVVETAEVVETVYQTTTVWVDSLPESTAVAVAAASATTHAGGEFYGARKSSQAAASVSAVPSTSSSSSAVSTSSSVFMPAPAPSTLATSISSSAAPVVPAYTPPAVSTTEAASTTTPAPVVVPTTSTYVAPAPVTTSTTSAVPAQSTGSSSSSGSTYSGDMTYYDIGLGSCGYMDFGDGQGKRTPTENDPVVAIAHGMMDALNGANSNNNPWCGKWINIVGPAGNTAKAIIADTCGGCQGASIDLPQKVFYEVAPTGDGRVHNVGWSFA